MRAVGCLLALILVGACATDDPVTPDRTFELIYGSELMTDEELEAYRAGWAGLPDATERDAFRLRHRTRLRERARDRGVDLVEPAGVLRRGVGP